MAIHIFPRLTILCLVRSCLKKVGYQHGKVVSRVLFVSLVIFALHFMANGYGMCVLTMCSHSVKKHTFLTIQIGPILAISNYYDQVSLERSQASGWLWDNDYPQLYQVKMEAQSAAAVKMLIFCQC